jgi:hypothetical protein
VPAAYGRLVAGRGAADAEAGEAGELQGEVLLVDPDLAALLAVAIVAEAEVEAALAAVADGGVRLIDGLAALGTDSWLKHLSSTVPGGRPTGQG